MKCQTGGDPDLFDKNHQFHRLDETMLVFVNSDEDTACSESTQPRIRSRNTSRIGK